MHVPWAVSQWAEFDGLTVTRTKSRYGNRLLGPKDVAQPEERRAIASVSYFARVWSLDPDLAKYIIRR